MSSKWLEMSFNHIKTYELHFSAVHTEVTAEDRPGFCQLHLFCLLTIYKGHSLVWLRLRRVKFPRPECQSSATKRDGYFNDHECWRAGQREHTEITLTSQVWLCLKWGGTIKWIHTHSFLIIELRLMICKNETLASSLQKSYKTPRCCLKGSGC